MTTLDELHDLMNQASATSPGFTQNDLWAKAAEIAENEGFEQEAVICYIQLVNGYATGGQTTEVVAPFIWCHNKYRERPDLFDTDLSYGHSWHFKYVLAAVRSVPSVPVEQCEAILEEMRKHYLSIGDGLRAYYIRKYLFAKDWGTDEEAEEAFAQWRTSPDSELSDCASCDPGYEVMYLSMQRKYEEAVKLGEAAIAAQNDNACDSQPEALLTQMMEPWSRVGNDASAWSAHTRAFRRYQEGPRYLEDHPIHYNFLTMSGMAGRPQRLDRCLRLLLRHLPWWTQADTPRVLLNLAVEGALLFGAFAEQADEQLNVTLPGEDLVWFPCETLVNPTFTQAREWMEKIVYGLAEQFDQRPGLKNRRIVEGARKRLNPLPYPPVTEQIQVPDVSGLYSSDEAEYGLASSRKDLAATTSATDKTFTLGESISDSSATVGEDSLAPIVLNTEWKEKSISQLFQATFNGLGTFSSAYRFLYHKLMDTQATLPSVDELTIFAASDEEVKLITEFWNTLVEYRFTPMAFPGEFCMDPLEGTPEAIVYEHLVEGHSHLGEGNWILAAEAFKKAMQVQDLADALGIRLHCLEMRGYALGAAQKIDDCLNTYRQVLNLYAALGLISYQALTGTKIAEILRNLGRDDEALTVLQAAVDAGMEVFSDESQSTVWFSLAQLYEKKELYQSALHYYQMTYKAFGDSDDRIAVARRIVKNAVDAGEQTLALEYQHIVLDANLELLEITPEKDKYRVVWMFFNEARDTALLHARRSSLVNADDKLQAMQIFELAVSKMLEISREEDVPHKLLHAVCEIRFGRVFIDALSPEQAEERLFKAISICEEYRELALSLEGKMSLGILYFTQERYQDMQVVLEEILSADKQVLKESGVKADAQSGLQIAKERLAQAGE